MNLAYSLSDSERMIDFEKGITKLNGDKMQFANMLLMFDKLTLNDSIAKIYNFLKNKNLFQMRKEIQMLSESSELIIKNISIKINQNKNNRS